MRKTLAGPMGIRILGETKHTLVNSPVSWELIQLLVPTEPESPRRVPAVSLTGTPWSFITCLIYVIVTYVFFSLCMLTRQRNPLILLHACLVVLASQTQDKW